MSENLAEWNARLAEINAQEKAAYEQRLKDANEATEKFFQAVTQREWLLVCRALDASREEIGADQGLMLMAQGWLTEKHAHGGASWDRLLDMTDDELLVEVGYPLPPVPVTELPQGDGEHQGDHDEQGEQTAQPDA